MKQEQAGAGESFQQQKVVEHPPVFYTINEVYSIRKDSINSSNDHIYKRLSRQFQKIKKTKAEANGLAQLSAEYDYDNCGLRRQLKKIHQLYNQSSKTHLIVKRRIEKMRQKVDKIKSQVERDELTAVKEIDVGRVFGKFQAQSSSQNNLSSTPIPNKGKQ